MFWLPVWTQYILEIGNSQRRVNLKESRRQSLCFLVTPSKRTACGGDTQWAVAIRQLSQRHLCPCESFIIPARKEMSLRRSYLHNEEGWIDGAQAHSMRKALDSPIRFAEIHLDPAAGPPSHRQVRVDQQCSVKEGSAIVELVGDKGERPSREAEYASIVIAQLERTSGQPSGFGNLLLSVDDPAKRLACVKTICGRGIRRSVITITFDSLVKQGEGFVVCFPSP